MRPMAFLKAESKAFPTIQLPVSSQSIIIINGIDEVGAFLKKIMSKAPFSMVPVMMIMIDAEAELYIVGKGLLSAFRITIVRICSYLWDRALT